MLAKWSIEREGARELASVWSALYETNQRQEDPKSYQTPKILQFQIDIRQWHNTHIKLPIICDTLVFTYMRVRNPSVRLPARTHLQFSPCLETEIFFNSPLCLPHSLAQCVRISRSIVKREKNVLNCCVLRACAREIALKRVLVLSVLSAKTFIVSSLFHFVLPIPGII